MTLQARFLLDNDGSNIFHHLGNDVESVVQQTVQECSPNVTTYLLCSAAGSCYFPTEVGCVDQRARGLLAAHDRSVDPFGMLLQGLKAAGKETFITYRMNDVHNPTDEDQWNTPRIRREVPDCIVGLEEVRRGRAEWMSYCLDYTRDDVRAYVLSLIAEQVALYGHLIDGFQLDWMRFPRHLSGSPAEIWAKRGVLTSFLAEVRDIMQSRERPVLLSVRVPTTQAGCQLLGFDIAAWGKRHLVDLLVLCPFLSTEWSIPVESMRRWLGNATIPIYTGFDFGFGEQTHFPESLRGVCSNLYDCGADGIYLFNFPCWTEYLAARPYHWLTGLDSAEKAATKPLLLSVEHRRHRVAVDQPGYIPVDIASGQSISIPLYVPKAALPVWRTLCLIHSKGDIALTVNGQDSDLIQFRDGHRSQLFLEFIGDNRPANNDCRLFEVVPGSLHAGMNELRIHSLTDTALIVERVNVGLW